MKIDFLNDIYCYLPSFIQAPILLWALRRADRSTKAYWRAYNMADYSQDPLYDIGHAYIGKYKKLWEMHHEARHKATMGYLKAQYK